MKTGYSQGKQDVKTKKILLGLIFFKTRFFDVTQTHSEVYSFLNAFNHTTIHFVFNFEKENETGIQKNKMHLRNFLSLFSPSNVTTTPPPTKNCHVCLWIKMKTFHTSLQNAFSEFWSGKKSSSSLSTLISFHIFIAKGRNDHTMCSYKLVINASYKSTEYWSPNN